MSFEVTKTDVWAGRIEDRPGALADKLENVMRAGRQSGLHHRAAER